MKRKITVIAIAVLLVAVCAVCFVACDPYKSASIGGGEPNATVESNGGYAVKQGKYLYFVNGYAGYDGDNTWGVPQKNGIVRAEIDADGKVKQDTAKLIVSKLVYTSADVGIAIYKDWVYYATYNSDKDKTGTASTTNMDFMRTKIDGSVTQLIDRIGTRTAPYIFTPSRILYYDSSESDIKYIDFSGMNENKSIDNGRGVKRGTLVDHVGSYAWDYEVDRVYYVKTLDGTENSYKNYNELHSVKFDGSDDQTLATENTFLQGGAQPGDVVLDPLNVFEYTLIDVCADGTDTAIYYSKTHMLDSAQVDGTFVAKASDFKTTEKKLSTAAQTTLYPLGYADGAMVSLSDGYYWIKDENIQNRVQVTESSILIQFVDKQNKMIYYTATSSATKLDRVPYDNQGNAATVVKEGVKVDGAKLEFIGDMLYFFATDDDSWTHEVNYKTFDPTAVDENGDVVTTQYIGVGHPEDEEEEEN